MLKRCIVAENRKLHASPIWAMFVVLPLISAGYGTFNYLQNLEILTERWYSLWTQHTLFYSMLFFPAMVSAYAAYLWRLEHMGHNWNLIMAVPVRPFDLFLAKFLVVVKLMCFTQVFVYSLYLVCGRPHMCGPPLFRKWTSALHARAVHARPLQLCLPFYPPCCIMKPSTNRRARHDCQCCRFCRYRMRTPL